MNKASTISAALRQTAGEWDCSMDLTGDLTMLADIAQAPLLAAKCGMTSQWLENLITQAQTLQKERNVFLGDVISQLRTAKSRVRKEEAKREAESL